MFNKLKQVQDIMKLRSEAKKLQQQLESVTAESSRGDITVRVSGTRKVLSITKNGEEMEDVVKVINDAMKEVEKKAAKKIMEEGGGLGGLLGGGLGS